MIVFVFCSSESLRSSSQTTRQATSRDQQIFCAEVVLQYSLRRERKVYAIFQLIVA